MGYERKVKYREAKQPNKRRKQATRKIKYIYDVMNGPKEEKKQGKV